MLAGVDGGSNAVTRVVALPGSGGTVNIASRRRCSMSDRFGGPFSKCGRARIITLSAISTMDARNQSLRSGWTAGSGIEWVLSGPWTAKAEYLYYDLGSKTVSGLAGIVVGPTYSWNMDTHGNIVRAGVNYRFNGY